MEKRFIDFLMKKDSKKIVKFCDNIQLVLFFILVLLVFLVLFFSKKELPSIFYILVIIFDLMIVIIFFKSRGIYQRVLQQLLFEEINLGKYLEIANIRASFSLNRMQLNEFIQTDKFIRGQVLFFRGQFQKALKVLELIDYKKITRQHRIGYQNTGNYYIYLSYLQLGDFQMMSKNLPDDYVALLEAIQAIKQGKPTDYFEKSIPKTHLESISTNYYLALNEINLGNPEKAKELFKKIANENPELFYVREARQYLEEN